MFLGASQRIFFLKDPKRISVASEPPEVLEEGKEEEEEEEEHRTHPLEESHLEEENVAPSRQDPTKELAHLKPLETETDRKVEVDCS